MSSIEGTYELIDGKGSKHPFEVRWHDRLCTHLLYLDRRQLFINDTQGYIFRDTERPVSKTLAKQMDTILSLPETGVDSGGE